MCHVVQELIDRCIASQTFIISYLKYQSSTFKTLRKKNEKSSRYKYFRRFHGFAPHCESAESGESSENFVLLPDKRRDYLLRELQLVANVENSEKLNQTSFLLGG